MNQKQFCKRLKYFIKDEKKASKEYSLIPKKIKLTKSEENIFRKTGKEEAKHRKKFIRVYHKYCRMK